KMSARRLRLLACACCRKVLARCHSGSLPAIELAERFADDEASTYELSQARYGGRFLAGHAAWAVCWGPEQSAVNRVEQAVAWVTVRQGGPVEFTGYGQPMRGSEFLADVFNDIIGPLDVAVSLRPEWLVWNDATVTKLAEVLYRDRAWEQMPV